MIGHDPYFIANPDAIETPAMVVFEAQVDANIATLCELVGGGANLMAHVKTHKSEAITRKHWLPGSPGSSVPPSENSRWPWMRAPRKRFSPIPWCSV